MNAEGWYTDPYGIHEMRWISDGMPTSLVRDHGLETDDEPPEGQPVPTEFVPAPPSPPAEAVDLLRADSASSGDQSFTGSDAAQAAVGTIADLSTGAGPDE